MAANTVLRPASTWVNNDGLVVRFGKGNQVDAVVGSPVVYGDTQFFIADILWERLPLHQSANTTGTIYGDYPNSAIPKGAFIVKATLNVDVAFAGSSAALTLGAVDATGQDSTNNSGFFTSTNGAVANLTLGAAVAGTGALVGTVLTAPAYLWAAVTGGDFTNGRARLAIEYFIPAVDANNS